MSTRLRVLAASLFLVGSLAVGATGQPDRSPAQTAPTGRVTILGSVVDASLSPLVGVAPGAVKPTVVVAMVPVAELGSGRLTASAGS